METRRVSLLVGKQSYDLRTSMTEDRLGRVSRLLADVMATTDPRLQQDERLFLSSLILASSLEQTRERLEQILRDSGN